MEGIKELAGRFWNQSLFVLWAGSFALGLVAEAFFRIEKQPFRDKLLNLSYALVYCLIIFFFAPSVFLVVNAVASKIGLGLIDLTFLRGENIPAQIGIALLGLLITDFFYYWLHRAQHASPWLWDQHAVHHSDQSLNVTTNTRHHWLEFIFQAFAIALPMAVLFKLPAVTVAAVATVFGAWTFFIHCNLRIALGRWSWIMVGPQVHRIHHSRLLEHSDKNFAAYFPIWDIVFGTYWAPRKGEFPPTGLTSGERMDSLAEVSLHPFKQWAWRGWKALRNRTHSGQ